MAIRRTSFPFRFVAVLVARLFCFSGPAQAEPAAGPVPRFSGHEVSFVASGIYANPYVDLKADVSLVEPDGHTTRQLPLFWDGGQTWRFRFAPDLVGTWRWSVKSADHDLNGQSGSFECVASDLRGSIQPMAGAPHHFQYQNGERMWFLGDTAWAYVMDNDAEKMDRHAAERYAVTRSAQGFNAIHLMLLGEIGWGNRNGLPWRKIADEEINPAYFQEVDERLAFANARGLVTGLAVAWADKGHDEPWSWGRFPNMAARLRYARYIAARYGAYNVYFLVAGEWDSELRRKRASEAKIRRNFVAIGDELRRADPHHRMIGIHPTMKVGGTTREYNTDSTWMDFADYEQNYLTLHEHVLASRVYAKPFVNGEYAYWLRDANADGRVDKANSYTLEDIRAATWDIAMAGGYLVTGFGSTYLGGARNLTTFLPDNPDDTPWIDQLAVMKRFFSSLDYWTFVPHDELVSSPAARTADRAGRADASDVQTAMTRPPATTYWCLANPGTTYLVYVRGTQEPVRLSLPINTGNVWQAEQFDPRTGTRQPLPQPETDQGFEYRAPDTQDWIVVVRVVRN